MVDQPTSIPIAPERIVEIERLYGGPLPTAYLDAMRVANGGIFTLDDQERAQVYEYRSSDGHMRREVLERLYYIGEERLDPDFGNVASATGHLRDLGLAPGILVLGSTENSTYLCMKTGGAIFRYPQDKGFENAGFPLAPSFDAFRQMIFRHPYRQV